MTAVRTVEQIQGELRAIVDGAEGRSLTDEEVTSYENLEQELETVRRDAEVRARQQAYQTPTSNPLINTANADKEDDEQSRAFTHYLRTGQQNSDLIEARALETGVNSEGGFTVPDGFLQRIVEVRDSFGGVAGMAEQLTTASGQPLEFPSIDDTANEGEIVAEEGAPAAGADLVFGTVTLGAFRYTTAGAGNNPIRVSVELLQDSAIDIESLLARMIGLRLARTQAGDWAVGSGTGEPTGIAHSGLTADVTQATSGTFTYEEMLDVEDAVDDVYLQNAAWMFNSNTWHNLRSLTDSGNGRPLILPQAEAGIGGRIPKQLLGYPVVIDNSFPNAANNTPFAVLGDIREAYIIRRVQALTVLRDPYSMANNGQVQFHAWERADGNIKNRSAYAVLAGATV